MEQGCRFSPTNVVNLHNFVTLKLSRINTVYILVVLERRVNLKAIKHRYIVTPSLIITCSWLFLFTKTEKDAKNKYTITFLKKKYDICIATGCVQVHVLHIFGKMTNTSIRSLKPRVEFPRINEGESPGLGLQTTTKLHLVTPQMTFTTYMGTFYGSNFSQMLLTKYSQNNENCCDFLLLRDV